MLSAFAVATEGKLDIASNTITDNFSDIFDFYLRVRRLDYKSSIHEKFICARKFHKSRAKHHERSKKASKFNFRLLFF